jgi:hypothetical protein
MQHACQGMTFYNRGTQLKKKGLIPRWYLSNYEKSSGLKVVLRWQVRHAPCCSSLAAGGQREFQASDRSA